MTTHPDIEKYQSAPQYAYLKKNVIVLAGKPPQVPERTMLLMEGCGIVDIKLGNIQGALRIRPKDDLSLALEKMYAPMAACSFGDVPTADEFLAMPSADIDIWLKAAREITPDNFEWVDKAEKLIDELTEDKQTKKKEKKRRRSAIG